MIIRKLATLVRMDPNHRTLLVEAIVWLAVARLALVSFPFRHVAKRLGDLAPSSAGDGATQPERDGRAELAAAIGRAVRRSACHTPFKAACLQQAIAAKMMLRRRGVESTLHFGVAAANPSDGTLRAHAWLDAAGTRVTGYPAADSFVEIACFR